VYSVEPEAYDDHRRSLAAGKRERNPSSALALCDSLLSPEPGELTWSLNSKGLAGAHGVSDDEVRRAIGYAFRVLKLVVEPGGAVGLAAVLAGKHDAKGRTVVLVLSGGNVDPDTFAACLKL
jgi:threonine dehydratase